MIRSNQFKTDDELLEMLKKLPIIPQTRKRKDGTSFTRMSICLSKIFENTPPDSQKRLEENKLKVAWD